LRIRTSVYKLVEPPEVFPLPDPPPSFSDGFRGSSEKHDVQVRVRVPIVPVPFHEIKPPVLTSSSGIREEPDGDCTSVNRVIGVLVGINLVRSFIVHMVALTSVTDGTNRPELGGKLETWVTGQASNNG